MSRGGRHRFSCRQHSVETRPHLKATRPLGALSTYLRAASRKMRRRARPAGSSGAANETINRREPANLAAAGGQETA